MKQIFTLLTLVTVSQFAFSQAPKWLWAKASGGGQYQSGTGISASPDGRIYMAGRMSRIINFGNLASDSTVTGTSFKGSFNADGSFNWISPHSYYYAGADYIYGFARDKHNNTYSTGVNGNGNPFVDKYDNNGHAIWNMLFKSGIGTGNSIVVDDSGNIFVSGYYRGYLTFGADTISNNYSAQNFFLVKLDSSGNCISAMSEEASANSFAKGVAISKQGYIFMNVAYYGTSVAGGDTLVASTGEGNLAIVKLNPAGQVMGVNILAGAGIPGEQFLNPIVIDSSSNLYITGTFYDTARFGNTRIISKGYSDAFVAKCSSDGIWQWVQTAGGDGVDGVNCIAIDKNNDVYTGGYYGSTAYFGDSVVYAQFTGLFVTKYSGFDGSQEWFKASPGSDQATVSGITVDQNGYVYVDGSFNANIYLGATELSCYAPFDNIFIAKLDTITRHTITVTSPKAFCAGTINLVSYTVSHAFNPGNIFTAQLSDSSGSFVNPLTIGTTTSTTSGTIAITTSSYIKSGNHYLIRVVSSNPAVSNNPNLQADNIHITGNETTVSNDTTICGSTPVTLNVTGGTSYSWSPNVGLSCTTCSSPVATPSVTTSYVVEVTANNLCGNHLMDTVVVTVGTIATAGNILTYFDTTCPGNFVYLSVSGNSSSILEWQSSTDKNHFYSIPGFSNSTSLTTRIYQTTYYRVEAGYGSCIGKTEPVMIYIPSKPVALFNYYANGLEVTFDTSSSSNVARQEWNYGDGTTGHLNTHTYANFGTYPVCLDVANGLNCSYDTLCKNIVVKKPGNCKAFFSLIADSTTPHHWFALNQSIGKAPISYSWSWGDGTGGTGDTASHTYTSEGYYSICLIINDDTLCTSIFCDSSTYLSRRDGSNTIVKVNAVNSLPTTIPVITSAKSLLAVHPNPCVNCIVTGSNNPNNLEITDVLGRKVNAYFTKTSDGFNLSLPFCNSGIYFIKDVKTGQVVKFVKE